MVRSRTMVQRNSAMVESLPAPVGGWNARDSYANMDPLDAIQLTNFFPNVSNVALRGGYSEHATGLGSQVQTLMHYSGAATSELWAFTAGGHLYDCTAAGAVGAAAVTGLTNGIWEYVNVANSGGNYIWAVNGVDDALIYDGSAWAAASVSGVSPTVLSNVTLFKNRLWFTETDSLNVWYLGTNAISGAATAFPLYGVAKFGGHVVALCTWTLDAGYGVDDYIAFMTSEGEVIVYGGTDPDSVNTFALVGVWKLGSPIGKRCMLKWGGDMLVLTYDGLLPMAGALQSSRLDPRVALSDKIQGAIAEATTLYGGDHTSVGWQIVYSAQNNAVWINVPVAVGSQEQFVMNTITKSWCNFTGWDANCWEIFEDDPYFGASGVVCKAWNTETYTDNTNNIETVAKQAFNYFGARGVKKYFTRARPSIFTDGAPAISVNTNVDFNTTNFISPLLFTELEYGQWDVSSWDDDIWGDNLSVSNTWLGITGIGYCASVQMQTTSRRVQIEWASTDIVYQQGWAGV